VNDIVVVALGAVAFFGIATATAAQRLRRANARYRDAVERRYNLLEAIPDGLYVVDLDECITLVNEEAERLLRSSSGDLVGSRLEAIVGPLASDVVPELRRARASGATLERTVSFRAAETWIELRVKPAERETLVYLRDVSERTRAEVRLRESESRLKLLMGQVPALVWTADRNGVLTSATGAGSVLLGTHGVPGVGRPIADVFADASATRALVRVADGEAVHFESAHGERRLRHDVEALRDDEGAIVGAVGVALDITEMLRTQGELHAAARRDALTGLPNRLGLEETLAAAIDEAAEDARFVSVFFVDLDRFKTINDTLGHRTGDELLCAVAQRLATTLQDDDVIARPGGDEFIVVARSVRDREDVQAVTARIQRKRGEPFAVDGRELFIGASVGVAIFPDHGTTSEELITNADVAMYRVKAAGRGSYAIYDGSMADASARRLLLENDLRQALARREFSVVYQPFVGASRRIVGCEALLRWHAPTHVDVSPVEFIPLLEEAGLIGEITRWVIEEACTFAAGIRRERADFRVNVNVSGRDLHDSELATHVRDILERTTLPGEALELEVTESVLLDDRAIVSLEKIRALGVRIAVDDFGVSYSVLSSVKRLPVTTLKIDRSFIEGLGASVLDQAIVKAIVALGKALGLNVVAEGVESESQLRFVLDLDVDEMQGYLTGRPMSAAAFLETVGKVIPLLPNPSARVAELDLRRGIRVDV
jgi:diguanylate cyclase (GGDEF)-like protein/PAS domain S-box-containing protein